jgi:hypothetical protein
MRIKRIVKTINIMITDLRRTYPSDQYLIEAGEKFNVLAGIATARVVCAIGELLDRYRAEIIRLSGSYDFTEFINKKFDDDVNDVKSDDRELVEYLINKVKEYVQTLPQERINVYVDYIFDTMEDCNELTF